MVDSVQRRQNGQQHLRRADVGGRFFTADVLLAGLQRHPERRAAGGIHRHPDDSARHLAFAGIPGGEERRMRPAVPHWNAEPLRGTDDDIGIHLTRRFHHHQRQQVAGHRHQGALFVGGVNDRANIPDRTAGAGVLDQHAEHVMVFKIGEGVALGNVKAQRTAPGFDDGERLRMTVVGDEKNVGLGFTEAVRHRHGLGRRGGFVQ